MSGNDELFQAMNMFKSGVADLQRSRVISDANDQVQQIRATEGNEQQQRAQLQSVANNLTMRMASMGTPASTIEATAGAIAPKQYANANQMYAQGLLTGNQSLVAEAGKQQEFEQNPAAKIQLAQAKIDAANAGRDPLRQQAADEKKAQFDATQFSKFSNVIDKSAASSRSSFGQWAGVESRGARLKAILGDPSEWQQMTPEKLELVKEGVVQMSKGGVMTQEEHKTMSPFLLKIQAAKAESSITGKPAKVDLAGYADMYNGLIDKESDASNKAVADIILSRATGNMKLHDRDADTFKATVADRLNKQAGLQVSPDDIVVDKKKGVSLKSSSPMPAQQQAEPAAPAEEVRMVSGRKAVFANKQFVRWM